MWEEPVLRRSLAVPQSVKTFAITMLACAVVVFTYDWEYIGSIKEQLFPINYAEPIVNPSRYRCSNHEPCHEVSPGELRDYQWKYGCTGWQYVSPFK